LVLFLDTIFILKLWWWQIYSLPSIIKLIKSTLFALVSIYIFSNIIYCSIDSK
jgi:hypothetical protein